MKQAVIIPIKAEIYRCKTTLSVILYDYKTGFPGEIYSEWSW